MHQFNVKRIPRDTLRAWKKEAVRLGLDLSSWSKQVLTIAASNGSPGVIDATGRVSMPLAAQGTEPMFGVRSEAHGVDDASV